MPPVSLLRATAFWAIWLVGLGVFVLDRATKNWATEFLAPVRSRPLFDDWFRLTYVENTGIAFGLGAGRDLPLAAVSLVALLLVIVLAFDRRSRTWTRGVALGLIVGGAAGNLHDRLRWGSVIDFLDFGYRRNWWPVFNVADTAISIGVVLFALTLLFARESDEPRPVPSDPSPGAGPTA